MSSDCVSSRISFSSVMTAIEAITCTVSTRRCLSLQKVTSLMTHCFGQWASFIKNCVPKSSQIKFNSEWMGESVSGQLYRSRPLINVDILIKTESIYPQCPFILLFFPTLCKWKKRGKKHISHRRRQFDEHIRNLNYLTFSKYWIRFCLHLSEPSCPWILTLTSHETSN